MQASSSRAGLAILNSSLAAAKTLPPCTCGALKSVRQMTSKSTAGSYNQSIQSPAPQVEARASLPYRGRSQAEKLATREQRTTVFLKGLRPRTTPNDVRRLVVQRAGHGGGVKEVVFLPTADLRWTGDALIEFLWAANAKTAVDKLRGKTSPGIVDDILDCRLVDLSKKPYPSLLQHRSPLASRAAVHTVYNQGPSNLKAGLHFSGRAVRLSGFPATIHPFTLIERLNRDGFYPVKGPGMREGWAAIDEIVHLKSFRAHGDAEKFVNYLVRLPSIAEAHRLASSWNATWPKYAMMNGEVRINAEIVW